MPDVPPRRPIYCTQTGLFRMPETKLHHLHFSLTNIAEWMGIGITTCMREAEDRQRSHESGPTVDTGCGNGDDYTTLLGHIDIHIYQFYF